MIKERQVVPFWSTRSRLEKVQKNHPKYQKYKIDQLTLEDFLDKQLPLFEKEQVSIGVDWFGTRLVGYDISVPELRAILAYRRRAASSERLTRISHKGSVIGRFWG